VVASSRSSLGTYQPGSLQILEDLLEESRGDRFTGGDIFDLGGPPIIVERDIEEGADAIAPLIRELHGLGLDCHIGYVKNS
jgi:hypothetical protein